MTTKQTTESKHSPEISLGKRIREVREKRGLSLEGLSRLTKLMDSEKVGISRTVLTGYEKGKFKPGARELRVLFETLGLTPNWLILGRSDPERIQAKFASEKEFEGELLKAIRTLDSDSLNGVAHLIFHASTQSGNLNEQLTEINKLAAHVVEKMEDDINSLKGKIHATKNRTPKTDNKITSTKTASKK